MARHRVHKKGTRMKKALVALALAAVASTASAAIATGSHDMTTQGGTLSACWYCHAPHKVNTGVPGAPLWNRSTPAGPFTVYTSGTLNQTAALGANSYTCLSCHDGVTDLGAMYTGSTETLGDLSLSYANVGVDLRDDHPVGVTYNINGTTDFATRALAEADGMVFYTYDAGVTYKVECGSCHDPHGVSDGATGGDGFLRAAKADMCTACHLK